jgi:hypothetical protein
MPVKKKVSDPNQTELSLAPENAKFVEIKPRPIVENPVFGARRKVLIQDHGKIHSEFIDREYNNPLRQDDMTMALLLAICFAHNWTSGKKFSLSIASGTFLGKIFSELKTTIPVPKIYLSKNTRSIRNENGVRLKWENLPLLWNSMKEDAIRLIVTPENGCLIRRNGKNSAVLTDNGVDLAIRYASGGFVLPFYHCGTKTPVEKKKRTATLPILPQSFVDIYAKDLQNYIKCGIPLKPLVDNTHIDTLVKRVNEIKDTIEKKIEIACKDNIRWKPKSEVKADTPAINLPITRNYSKLEKDLIVALTNVGFCVLGEMQTYTPRGEFIIPQTSRTKKIQEGINANQPVVFWSYDDVERLIVYGHFVIRIAKNNSILTTSMIMEITLKVIESIGLTSPGMHTYKEWPSSGPEDISVYITE